MHFRIVSRITEVEVIASGKAIPERRRLWKAYGKARWRKLKGSANIEIRDGTICQTEIHWSEAHGIGAKEYKIKRLVG
jgi:hypothetical protein